MIYSYSCTVVILQLQNRIDKRPCMLINKITCLQTLHYGRGVDKCMHKKIKNDLTTDDDYRSIKLL